MSITSVLTSIPRPLRMTAVGGACLGACVAGYAAREARQYTLRHVSVPLLPEGADPIRVLHLSDIHLAPDQRRKRQWLSSLAGLSPDLVINTGDNLAHQRSVPLLLDALGGLLDVPGVFVLGSNDYFEPGMRNPFAYLMPDTGKRHTEVAQLPWRDMVQGFTAAGWLNLTNTTDSIDLNGLDIAFSGVDDPHLDYDDLSSIPSPAPRDADVRIGVAHAPYLRVLDRFAATGHDAIIAGHTHGGQVCLPGGRALATNCDLEPARAKGLNRHPADSAPGDPDSAWLHVSAGLGTNPYVRFRLNCRPEATLMDWVPVR